MSIGQDVYRADIHQLVPLILGSDNALPLENYLIEHDGDSTRDALFTAFADVMSEYFKRTPPPFQLEALLESWINIDASVKRPQDILSYAAVAAVGKIAATRLDWSDIEINLLYKAIIHPRFAESDAVVSALRYILDIRWEMAYMTLVGWLLDNHPLVIRTLAASVADPRLLITETQIAEAMFIQVEALGWLVERLPQRRALPEYIALRDTLRTALELLLPLAPAQGLALLEKFSTSPDPDIQAVLDSYIHRND